MIQITRNDLERNVPVAQTATDDLLEAVMPFIETAQDVALETITGDVGEKALLAEGNERLKASYVAMACAKGFRSALRELDLVVTPTGFGVVSTETLSPASKDRVNALKEHLDEISLGHEARLVDGLRKVEGWGETAQAAIAIPTVMTAWAWLYKYGFSQPEWQEAQEHIRRADTKTRALLGDRMVDEALADLRTDGGQLTALLAEMERYALYHVSGAPIQRKEQARRLLRLAESDRELYKAYHESEQYKARHEERFENTKDSAAYLFG